MRSVSYWRSYFYAALLGIGLAGNVPQTEAVEILNGEFQSAFNLQGLRYNGNLGPAVGEIQSPPTWHISQWGGPDWFQPVHFNSGWDPNDGTWSLAHQYGWIYVMPDGNGSGVTMYQHKDGNTPGNNCFDGGAGEWDMLLEPNDPIAFPAVPPEAQGMIPVAQRPYLHQISLLTVRAGLMLHEGWHQNTVCPPHMNVANLVIGVVAHNWEIGMGFFYQLMLYDSRNWQHHDWYDYTPGPDGTIFSADSVEVHGRQSIRPGEGARYAIDIRQRMIDWLNANPSVPAQARDGVGWQIVAYYAGSAVTNEATIMSTWHGVSLDAR